MAQKPESRKSTTPQPDRVERSILRLAFDKDNRFQTDLRRRVDEYFQQGGVRMKSGSWKMYLKSAFIQTGVSFSLTYSAVG